MSENGDIYIAASLKSPETIQIIKLNDSFEIQYITEKGDFSDCGYYIRNIFIGKDGNPVLCTESDMSYINILSPDSGKTNLRYELPVVEQILGSYGDKDLIYRNGNTIYGYDYINDNSIEMYTADADMYNIVDAYIEDGAVITSQLKKEDNSTIMNIISTDGKSEKSISIPGDYYVSDMNITSDGTVYLLTNDYGVEYTDDGVFETSKPEIQCIRNDGTIETVYTGEQQYSEILYLFASDNQGNICLSGDSYTTDDNTTHVIYISSTGEQTDMEYEFPGHIGGIKCINDEFNIVFYPCDNSGLECLTVDKDNMTINKTDNSFNPTSSIIDGCDGYDYFYSSGSNILGYHSSDGSSEKIFSWFDSDVISIPESFTNIAITDTDNIFYINDQYNYDDSYDNEPENQSPHTLSLIHLKKADEARLKELNSRNIITVAGTDLNQTYFSQIKQFNKDNNDYMIIATDYSEYDPESGTDNSVVLSKFEKDIIQGNIPDVIIGDQYSFDIQSFISNGTLADLNDMLKNDPQTGSDLAENILDACRDNGKLYSIPLNINLETLTVPEEFTDNNQMLTYDEFFNLWDNCGDRHIINCSLEHSLSLLSCAYINDNIDFTNATCSFKTDIFKKILEKTKQLQSDEYFNTEGCMSETPPEILFGINFICSVYDFYSCLSNYDCNESKISNVIKGIPSYSDISTILDFDNYLCITNSSDNKEGAWEMVKYFITKDIPHNMMGGNDLSILRSKNQNGIDQILSDMSDNPEVYSKSDTEKLQKSIDTIYNGKMICNHRYVKIQEIISEEANNYFNDTQSLDETVSAIESKVNLYLSEIK